MGGNSSDLTASCTETARVEHEERTSRLPRSLSNLDDFLALVREYQENTPSPSDSIQDVSFKRVTDFAIANVLNKNEATKPGVEALMKIFLGSMHADDLRKNFLRDAIQKQMYARDFRICQAIAPDRGEEDERPLNVIRYVIAEGIAIPWRPEAVWNHRQERGTTRCPGSGDQ